MVCYNKTLFTKKVTDQGPRRLPAPVLDSADAGVSGATLSVARGQGRGPEQQVFAFVKSSGELHAAFSYQLPRANF